MNPVSPPSFERYLAVDLHKRYVVIGGLNARQEVVLPLRRIDLTDWPKWAEAHLHKTDILVIEATTNTWDFYDQVVPLVGRAVVANALKVAQLTGTKVKTDGVDVWKLAKLLVVDMIPEVWVPPVAVRELRALGAHRRQLIKNRTMLRNRLESILHRHQLVPPDGNHFSAEGLAWWKTLKVSPTEQLHIQHDLATLATLEPQIAEVDAELQRLSVTAPWAEQTPYLSVFKTSLIVLSANFISAQVQDFANIIETFEYERTRV